MYGFTGKILHINLDAQTFKEIKKDENYYREYIGGSYLCAALFEEFLTEKITDPFSSQNPMVFATGPMAGESVCGATRVNVFSMSPETPGVYLSQAGGEFGPELKRAGFDAMVITGSADSPVYIRITVENDKCKCEFCDAKNIWGKDRIETKELLESELPDKFATASIGPAGEKLVTCANIMFEVDHYAGRGGLGAVMGSKNLKAICVKGGRKPIFKDKNKIKEINKIGSKRFREATPDSFTKILKEMGTFGLVPLNQDAGNLPTCNFNYSFVDSNKYEKEIGHENIKIKYSGKSVPCKACYLSCKKKYNSNSQFKDYTALAEYESIAILGPNIGLEENFEYGIMACELCNRLGLDTISAGNIIAWIMDCCENGVLDKEKLGFSIKFGDGEKACELLENIALRKDKTGNLLADGFEKASLEFGTPTKKYIKAVRGMGLPAHMPRVKPGVGFGYLHGPNPADHIKHEHDWIAADSGSLKDFGLEKTSRIRELDNNKVDVVKATQIYFSMIDVLSLCMFVFGPGNVYTFEEITEMVNAATGLELTFNELMKIGEKSIQLQKKLYSKLGGSDEVYLPFLGEDIPSGPSHGAKITENDFNSARDHYYRLWNWDEKGIPK